MFSLGSLGGRRLGPRGPSVVHRVRCLDPEAWVLDAGDFADTVWRTPLEGLGHGNQLRRLGQLRDMGYASEMMGSGYGWCLRALAGACRPEVVDMLTGGG